MAAPINLSFETAGATPGSALGWTAVSVCTAIEIGDYKTGGRSENFEADWGADPYLLSLGELEKTDVGGAAVEPVVAQFEHGSGWLLGAEYKSALGQVDVETAIYDLVQSPPGYGAERFSITWNIDGYVFDPLDSGTDTAVGQYDGQGSQAMDSFQSGLLSGYQATFAPGDTTTGHTESFAMVVQDTTWSATAGSATLASPNPPMVNAAVLLSVDAGGTMVAPFGDTTYWVVASGVGTFQLSATQGGSAITATDAGSGTMRLTVDPDYGWTLLV